MIADGPAYATQLALQTLLTALAHPGRVLPISENIDAPGELGPAMSAAILGLFESGVTAWISPRAPAAVTGWLAAQTGCRFVAEPGEAIFAIALRPRDALPLRRWHRPAAVSEPSMTLLVRVADLCRRPADAGGAGFGPRDISPRFERDWSADGPGSPPGLDVLFFDTAHVAAFGCAGTPPGRTR